MDKIYVPECIGLDYKYAVFTDNGNIELYQKERYDHPGSYKVWTLYKNNQNKIIADTYSFDVQDGETKFISSAHDVELSHNWYDRPDCLTILCFFCFIAVITLWLTNLFTSIFKKGGILSGLF